jgi:catechol 2,3-dioxygenase-like lactoylglutathione lyase family enzyme
LSAKLRRPLVEPTLRGVHHLALCTDEMKATIDFYVDVLGMPLVHAMKVPPGLGLAREIAATHPMNGCAIISST